MNRIRKTIYPWLTAGILLAFWAWPAIFSAADSFERQQVGGLILEKTSPLADFSPATDAQFEFSLSQKRSGWRRSVGWIKDLFVDEYKNLEIAAAVAGADGEPMPAVAVRADKSRKGKISVRVWPIQSQIRPGRYQIKLFVKDADLTQGQTALFTQDFRWGVLALNADQDIYRPGETANLAMAVLDDKGDTLCRADLTLTIQDPNGRKKILSTGKGEIKTNPACALNNVIDEPDYWAAYQFAAVGEYEYQLSAATANGERAIAGRLIVRADREFAIARRGPTRIMPKAEYEMKIIIKPSRDFFGDITETVPAGFVIKNSAGGQPYPIPDIQYRDQQDTRVIWRNINIKPGETFGLSYVFDAPDQSPEFYLLGPLKLVDKNNKNIVIEERSWQIASDNPGALGSYFKNYDAVVSKANINYTTDGWQEVAEYQIASTTFTAGKKYLLGVNFSITNISSNAAQHMARVRHGAAAFDGSGMTWEDARVIAAHIGHAYNYFTVWTAVAGEDINVDVSVYGGTDRTINTEGYEAFVLKLSDDLAENTDWFFSTASHAGNLPNVWTTTGASVVLPGGGKNWLILGLGHFLSDSTSADLMMRLFNATSSAEYANVRYETEDINDERPVMLMLGANVVATSTWRVDARVDTANTHDWDYSQIFALNLDKFRDQTIGYSANSVALSALDSWFETYSLNHTAKAAGDALVWSMEVVDTGDASKAVYSRLTVDDTVVPAGHDDAKRELPHGTTDEDAHHNFYLGSLSAGPRRIDVDMNEDLDISPNPAVDIHSLVIFSLELKSPPTGAWNSVSQKTDGSGAANFSLEIADADWEEARAKLEFTDSAVCAFGSSSQIALAAEDSRTTADYGDPQVDNNLAYQLGTSTGWIRTASGSNTILTEWDIKTDLPTANGETYCLRLTANDFTYDQAAPATTTLAVDNTPPTLSAAIAPDLMYKIGDTLRATITVASDAAEFFLATSTINNGTTTNLLKINDTTYTLDYIVAAGDTDRASGTIPYSIILRDSFGNQNSAYAGNFTNGSLDANAPAIQSVILPDRLYKIGDTLRATITVASDAAEFAPATSTINNGTTTNLLKINDTTYTLDYIVAEGDTDRASGTIPYSLRLRDPYGNVNEAYAGSFTDGSLDAHRPVISAVYITNGAYGIGSNITLVANTGESGLSLGNSLVNGQAAWGLIDNGNTTYDFYYTVQEGDIDRTANTIPISIVLADKYGNTNTPYTNPENNTASVDAHKPVITGLAIPDSVYKIGDLVRATATVSADADSYTLGTTTINGINADNLQKISDTTYTFDYTVLAGHTDRAVGTIPISAMFKDAVGQYNDPAFSAVDENTAVIDGHAPAISSVSFLPNFGVLKIGDTATATITAADNESGLSAGATLAINGQDVSATFAEIGAGQYRATYTVQAGDADRLDTDDLPVNFIIQDSAGNQSAAYTTADAANRPGADGHAPTAPGSLTFNAHGNDFIVINFGATSTESNFSEYKIFYKIGLSGVTEGDEEWNSGDDAALGNINFLGAATTTITGLNPDEDYVFNIWAYDQAGNKSSAIEELQASTNRPPLKPDSLAQNALGGESIANGAWTDQEIVYLSASSSEPEGEGLTYYYELLPAAGNFTASVSEPASACANGSEYYSCPNKIWSSADQTAWYDSRWAYRKKIVIDSRAVEDDLADFPILATTTDADLAAQARADAYDIIFTAGDGTTLLDFEREYWSAGNGELAVWIKNDLKQATDTVMYMYYGYADQDADLSTTTGVWDSNFKGVWHLDESPANGGTHYDSTINAANGTLVDADSDSDTAAAGQIDGADRFTGDATNDDYINISNFTGLNGSYQAMVSYWAKQDTNTVRDYSVWGNNNVLIEHGASYGSPQGAANIRVRWNLVTTTWGNTHIAPNVLDANIWHYWTFAYNNGTTTIYKDGAPIYTAKESGANTRINTTATAYQLACRSATGCFDGSLDEIRIEARDRGSAWVRTAFTNQFKQKTFARWQAAESAPMATSTVEIRALPDAPAGYKWQVLACDEVGACSAWSNFNDSAPNLRVDHTRPSRPGALAVSSVSSTGVVLDFGAPAVEENFLEYKIFYQAGNAGVSEGGTEFSSSSDANLGKQDYQSAATTSIDSLTAGTKYFFNIIAYDEAGNSVWADEISTTTPAASNPPISSFISAVPAMDGSGQVTFSVAVDDADNNDTVRLKLEYEAGGSCAFSAAADPTINEADNSTSATYGDPQVDNQTEYQIGSSTGWILTSPGENTVNFVWLSQADLDGLEGTYCLRLTANDGTQTQTAPATTTVYLDNLKPTAPGPLDFYAAGNDSITLSFTATSAETNFAEYKIFHKPGADSVSETDSAWASSSDPILGNINFGQPASTTITGLATGTQYVFNIWAYDQYGNRASSAAETAAHTNRRPGTPSALSQTKSGGAAAVANGAWLTSNTVSLAAAALDEDGIEIINLYFELLLQNDTLTTATTVPLNPCASTTSWGDCLSKVWTVQSLAGDYQLTPFAATSAPADLPETAGGLKWQVLACDDQGACSEWQVFDPATPNFKIDSIAPLAPADLTIDSYRAESITVAFNGTTTEDNFREYIIYYALGTENVAETDTPFASTSDLNLSNINFFGAATTTISGLGAGLDYVFNIWAYDQAGNKASATAMTASTNNFPNGAFFLSGQKADGSKTADLYFSASDPDGDDETRARLEYAGADCDFSSPSALALDMTDTNATSTYGDAKIENSNYYQAGNNSGWIITSSGANLVSVDWLVNNNLPNTEGDYCLRLIVYDGHDEQVLPATTTISVDTLNPTAPGDLKLFSRAGETLTLSFGASTTESHFHKYRLFYKAGVAAVTESDSEQMDDDLDYQDYRGTATTTVINLSPNTQYSFKIFAYDHYGNKSSSGQTTFTTNSRPSGAFNPSLTAQKIDGTGAVEVSIQVYDTNGDPCRAKLEYAGADCDFSSPQDPTLDENSATITADYGQPAIADDYEYQIGTGTDLIVTASGANNVKFHWLSATDLAGQSETYCLRLTVFDGADTPAAAATTTLLIDNLAPSAPGNLSAAAAAVSWVKLNFSATSSDDNFKEYKIFYKAGSGGVTENDSPFTAAQDGNLAEFDYGGAASTTITGLAQATPYYFNIWAYDDFGNRTAAALETATTTLVQPSATWRETEDAPLPTAGVYAVKNETLRLRFALANLGDIKTESVVYTLEYGQKSGTCEAIGDWTTVPADSGSTVFVMADSEYFNQHSSTTARLLNIESYPFAPGYMVKAGDHSTGYQILNNGYYTELEYALKIQPAAQAGGTYCFRVTQSGARVNNYGRYPEISVSPPPDAAFVASDQLTDGSDKVRIGFTVDHDGELPVRARVEYASDCSFAPPGDPSLDTENISATYGQPGIDNNSDYQIGTSANWIITQEGENEVYFNWLAGTDAPAEEGDYCWRLTANDGYDDQSAPATTSVSVDTKAPSAPGNLSVLEKTMNSVTLGFGATSSDGYFREYKIFYREGASGVTESDFPWASSSDASLGAFDYQGAASTTITGLIANKQYVFRIWAYDDYGHKTPSAGEVSAKLVPTISGVVYDAPGGSPVLSAPTVTIAVNGFTRETQSALAGNGRFTFSDIDPPESGTPIAVFLNNNLEKGAVYFRYGVSGSINDLDIYQNYIIVRHDDAGPITVADLDSYDGDNDPDIKATVSGESLVLAAGHSLYVWPGDIFLSGDNILSFTDIKIKGSFIASGTQAITVYGGWDGRGGVFAAASSTVEFAAGSGSYDIFTAGADFYNLIFNGAGASWNFADNVRVLATTTLNQGALQAGGDNNFETRSLVIANGASFEKATGTGLLIFEGDGQDGYFQDDNYPLMDLGNAQIGYSPAVTRLNSDFSATSLTVNSGDSFFTRGYEVGITNYIAVNGIYNATDDKEGDGTITTLGTDWTVAPSATFVAANSTTTFNGAGASLISTGGTDDSHDFYHLAFAKASLATSTLSGYELQVSGNLAIGANSILDVGGNNYDITALGGWQNSGQFIARQASTTFSAVGPGHIIQAGNSPFYNIIFDSAAGGWTIASHATSSNDWRITSASSLSVAAGQSVAVTGKYIISDSAPSATAWAAGSALRLGGSQDYTIGAKSQDPETYARLLVGPGLEITLWNSSSTLYDIDDSSVLYSIHHHNDAGQLFIWGQYEIGAGRTEYWSRLLDFDGTDISASPRPAVVRIADNSAVIVNGGTLRIIGATGASTTISRQGTGAYGLSVSAGELEANYYEISGLDQDGLELSGSPVIHSLDNGSFELTYDSGALISIASSVLAANPYATTTDCRFATSTDAASGINVALTGLPPAPWTFTNHYGGLAGDDFDSDPFDPRGYLVWDDSPDYTPRSQDWRWFHDEKSETPSDRNLTSTNTMPVIGPNNILKLRLTVKETGGLAGQNVKMRLEYSTYSDFSADVWPVGEIGSTTSAWNYGDGADNDNDPITTHLVFDADALATHNESGLSFSDYAHATGSAAEWEFTIHNHDGEAYTAENERVYYFRPRADYDLLGLPGEKAVVYNDSEIYPSVMVSTSSLTFVISGLPAGTATEGVVTDIASSPLTINYGSLPWGAAVNSAQRLVVTTNAEQGYRIFVKQRQDLTSQNGSSIYPISYPNSSPAAWNINPNVSGFGYHTGDETLTGVSPSRFAPDNTYARFDSVFDEIGYHPLPAQDDVFDMVYRLEITNMQASGEYETGINYVVIPNF